jgi:RimJ/RimL family protein N-acetyltransferase
MIFARSARLALRRPRLDDVDTLMRLRSDPILNRFTGPPKSEEWVVNLVREMESKSPGETRPSPWYQFMIERALDGEVIGDIGVGFDIPGEHQVELGYRIDTPFHRQGYAREALATMIDYLVAEHRTHRFVAVTAALNHASTGLLHSLGFRREGVFRESFLCHGEWLDDHYFALLASEWEAGAR